MTQSSKRDFHKSAAVREAPSARENTKPQTAAEWLRAKSEHPGMKLIPWKDIWTSLHVAKIRGNGEMVEVFYDTLFKDAVFDDRGAWSLDIPKTHH